MLKRLTINILILFTVAIIFIFSYNLFYAKNIPLPQGTAIDSLCVWKEKRLLQVFTQGKCLKTYEISLGSSPIGDKQIEGDHKTPEGLYSINDKNPKSRFHRNLGISYPNETDIAEATNLGKEAGKDIKIHGLGKMRSPLKKLHLWMDWTAGCIAITNEEIEELYEAVAIGTPILILK
jgi:murein L,D-transpeptidase YafK